MFSHLDLSQLMGIRKGKGGGEIWKPGVVGLLWTSFYIQVLPRRGKLQEADKKGRGYNKNLW